MKGLFSHADIGTRDRLDIHLQWLLRLRWLSVAGQILVILIFTTYYDFILPLGFLAGCVAITAATNAATQVFRSKLSSHSITVIAALLILDTAVLTSMLHQTGGAHNPFSSLYLLHITLAAILLPSWGPWVVLGSCSLGFFLLFSSPHELQRIDGPTCCSDMETHLRGMLAGMMIAGTGIAFFVGRLSASLHRQQVRLKDMRAAAARNERFASLATLSAGLAHELATPLSSIAVVSADLERHVCEVCQSRHCLEDAKLIRNEVNRCRTVLDRVANEITLSRRVVIEPLRVQLIPELLKSFLSKECMRRTRFALPDRSFCLKLPETALLQALAVLVKNACEASPPDQPVVLRCGTSNGEIVFVMEDSGAGMSPEVADKAGEPFFTTKEPGDGMGLGLFVVRVFVEGMNGNVTINSKEGRGTTVQLTFPATCADIHDDETETAVD